jgi:hypothetical protein
MAEQKNNIIKLFNKEQAKKLKDELDDLKDDDELEVNQNSLSFAKQFIDIASDYFLARVSRMNAQVNCWFIVSYLGAAFSAIWLVWS